MKQSSTMTPLALAGALTLASLMPATAEAGRMGSSFNSGARSVSMGSGGFRPVTPGYYQRSPSFSAARPVTSSPMSPPAWKVVTPARPDTLARVGGSRPLETFNRRSIGGASGVNPALRDRAYKAMDAGYNRHNYGNKGPVSLPTHAANGAPLKYRAYNLRNADHPMNRSSSNGRVVVGKSGSNRYNAYVSRHYGQDGGKVVRIQ